MAYFAKEGYFSNQTAKAFTPSEKAFEISILKACGLLLYQPMLASS